MEETSSTYYKNDIEGRKTSINWGVPTKMVGRLIGSNGWQLKSIEEDSQCTLLIKDGVIHDGIGEEAKILMISGSGREEVERARSIVSDLVGGDFLPLSLLPGEEFREGEVVRELLVPVVFMGFLMGRSGRDHASLCEETGCQIQIPSLSTVQFGSVSVKVCV